MKKLFTVAVFLLSTFALHAQVGNFQIKGGVGISTFTGKDAKDLKAIPGWKLGLGCEYKVSDKFSIDPSLMFDAKGAKTKGDEYEKGETFHLDYLTLPVLATWHITDQFHAGVGPYFSYGLCGTKDAFKKDGGNYSRFEAGIDVGASYSIDKFNVGVDFTYGLTRAQRKIDFEDEDEEGASSSGSYTPKMNSLTVGVTLGYTL